MGFGTFTIGLLWAAAIVGEVLFFAFSQRIMQVFGVERLLAIGLCGGIIRWTGTAFVTNEYLMLVLQALHGVSFACAHFALMQFIRAHVPANLRNTAQGLYAALAGGVLLSSVTWVSGPLYQNYGGKGYLAMALISASGLAIALYYIRTNPKTRSGAAT